MKKIILCTCVVAGLATASFGQGVIYFDGSNNTSTSPTAPSEGSVFLNGVLDKSTDINAELLWSSTANGTFSSVVTLLLSQATSSSTSALGTTQSAVGDVSEYGSGILIDTSGNAYIIPTIGSGSTGYFEVLAWTGSYSTYAAAQVGGALTGNSGVFSEVLASATGTANDIEGMPALNLTPAGSPAGFFYA
jgi:hypothetical protein